jgi:hypothetical protein
VVLLGFFFSTTFLWGGGVTIWHWSCLNPTRNARTWIEINESDDKDEDEILVYQACWLISPEEFLIKDLLNKDQAGKWKTWSETEKLKRRNKEMEEKGFTTKQWLEDGSEELNKQKIKKIVNSLEKKGKNRTERWGGLGHSTTSRKREEEQR